MSEKMNCLGFNINQGVRSRMTWIAGAAAISLCGIGSAFAVAPTPAFTWDATGTSDYNTPTNWNPDLSGPPMNTDNQFLTINNGATAAINSDAQGAFLILGLSTGQSGNLVINGGTTSTFGEIRIGGRESVPDDYNSATPVFGPNNGGTGTVIQNPGSTVNVNYNAGSEPPVASFYVGDSSGLAGNTANGSYTITGTAALPSVLLSGFANNDAIVVGTGVGTVGNFTQNAFTTVTSTGFVTVGRRGANGTYNLNGGTLNAQAGGTNTALFVGDGDTTGIQTTSGTFNHNNGIFNIAGNASIGRRGGDGFYNMVNGELDQSSGTLIIGDGVGATTAPGTNGTFTQTGGDVNPINLTVAQLSGTGVYTMSGGTLDVTTAMSVGSVGSVTAGLTAANGTLNLSGTGAVTVGGNLNLSFGSSSTQTQGVGAINMSGGSLQLNAAGAIFAVGNGLVTSATVNLSGGTISVLGATSVIDIGRNNAPGTFNVSGAGTLNAHQITVDSSNAAATRTLSISGGTVDLDILTLGSVASPATRLVDISGGTVNIGALTTGQATGAGSAVTYIHGGTVALENTVEYFSGSTFRLGTINLSVPAATTYGNATVDVLAGSTLTHTGSFGTGSSSRTLTKSGPGTLTIAGTQSYSPSAAAVINGGTINYNAAATGTDLTVTVNSSGILGGNGTVGGAVINNGTIAPGVASGVNIGTLTTNAGVTDGANSNWAIQLNGALSDQLAVNGDIDLSAVDALNVSGSPGASTSWIIGTYTGALTGVFDTVTSGYSVTYTGGNITLNLAGLSGDFNNDGKVDAADYVTWRKNPTAFGGSAGYDQWRRNFGAPGAGASLGGNQSVPEPGTLLLALAGILSGCVGRRRR
jgi:fibronectin-binding autotransporter adhesin